MADQVSIYWMTPDGEEHEELWDSLDSFLSWAAGDNIHGQWRAYEADEDGDWVLVSRGIV